MVPLASGTCSSNLKTHCALILETASKFCLSLCSRSLSLIPCWSFVNVISKSLRWYNPARKWPKGRMSDGVNKLLSIWQLHAQNLGYIVQELIFKTKTKSIVWKLVFYPPKRRVTNETGIHQRIWGWSCMISSLPLEDGYHHRLQNWQ